MQKKISKGSIPSESLFGACPDRYFYWDSFQAPLMRLELSVADIYLGVFSHYPWWARLALVARTRLVAVFGLKGPSFEDFSAIDDVVGLKSPKVGEKFGRFTLFSLNEAEIVVGGDDRHMDFRVSVMRISRAGIPHVVLSTVAMPRHRLGVKMLLANALAAGRV